MMRTGEMLPSIVLESADGSTHNIRHGNSARAIVALHGFTCAPCREYVRSLCDAASEIDAWGAAIHLLLPGRAHGPEAPPLLPGSFSVLFDPDATLTPVTVAAVDQWGEIYDLVEDGGGHDLPATSELVEWLKFISIQCPECEGPEGEWRSL